MQSYIFRMNFGSFVRICFMEKRLKIGLICMILAVVLMPLVLLLRASHPSMTVAVLIFTMFLELIGLTFVILSMLKRRKS